jgi:UDP-N-acetylmuramyl pentapeptide phosphotransferase/UDP-N-acetylglucosamine-1-phosphate transferase
MVVAAACLVASAAGVAAFTSWATRARLLDVPNERSSHQVPTPRGAGAIIVIVVAAAGLWSAYAGLINAGLIGGAALTIAFISAIDDARPLPSALRLLVHFGCAAIVVLALVADGREVWSWGVIVLAVLWIVGLTNAYNFMDGVDGISGAQAVVSGITVAIVCLPLHLTGYAVAGTAVASASGGFLLFNWSPARVFMGDVGAAFLGFVFAALALQIGAVSFAAGMAVVLSLWPFLFDTTLTLLRRMARRENIFASHRSHLYQRLVIAGWSHARVTLVYSAMAAIGAVTGVWWSIAGVSGPVPVAVGVLAAVLYVLVLRVEAAQRSSHRGGANAAVR